FPKFTEIAGFSLIVISCFLFTEQTTWPSYNALVPVLGAFFILLANQQNSIFTKPKLLQWLGNNSYSIYLWHWPIVFYLYYFYEDANIYLIVAGIIFSIILGFISYRFIEIKSRIYLIRCTKFNVYLIWFLAVLLLSIISLSIFLLKGIPSRFNHSINSISNVSQDKNPNPNCMTPVTGTKIKSCKYGEGKVVLLVVGDSHSEAMLNGVIHALPKNTSLIYWGMHNCPTVKGLKKINSPQHHCGNLVEKIIKKMRQDYPDVPVLIINRLNMLFRGESIYDTNPIRYIKKPHSAFDDNYLNEMREAYLATLSDISAEHKVYVTRPTPEAHYEIPYTLAKSIAFGLSDKGLKIPYSQYQKRSQDAWLAQDIAAQKYGVHIIDLSEFFCDKKYCYFTKDGIPLFLDTNHMAYSQSTLLTPYFKQIFQK
ncbi:acyltransferase family protein, partial [Acinetobacter soli]|uniref:acyltransferase family protein n=1 Tax=Acinetobacter soli TaxID=487316 RepID=UPI001260036A